MSLDIYENAIVHNTLLRKRVFLFSQLDSIDEKIDYDGVSKHKRRSANVSKILCHSKKWTSHLLHTENT
ncbi:membrane protein [Salmonella enterica subsp. enterica]|uniref:Membrane protein n=1 Tax=Salmonella enterica I TaxID=59201 RepID=A0A379VRT6_SALET|nr:membrane protein [Salmonella enterica subsp. enterica]